MDGVDFYVYGHLPIHIGGVTVYITTPHICLAIVKADLIIFDNALSPSQARNLNLEIGLPILARTALILEIFHSRARSREA